MLSNIAKPFFLDTVICWQPTTSPSRESVCELPIFGSFAHLGTWCSVGMSGMIDNTLGFLGPLAANRQCQGARPRICECESCARFVRTRRCPSVRHPEISGKPWDSEVRRKGTSDLTVVASRHTSRRQICCSGIHWPRRSLGGRHSGRPNVVRPIAKQAIRSLIEV